MIKKKLEYWKKKLIDLTKRNNLISYRFTTSRSIKLKSENLKEIFEDINSEEAICFLKENSEKKEHAVYTNESDKIVEKKLYNIYLKAKSNFQELGINTCFLGIGMLQYREKNEEENINAPIFLQSVEISKIKGFSNILQKYEILPNIGELKLNPALKEKLNHEFGIKLEEFKGEPLKYIKYFKEKIKGLEGWKILNEVYLDIFSYQKYIMYEDLNQNEEIIKKSQLVNAYIGDYETLKKIEIKFNEFIDSNSVEVLPADSSQKKAIELAKAGASFVLQGPPGTGKSQTIVNIISELIKMDKKVLFVSQKMAALNVVQKKLEQLGLSRYCLNLHTYQGKKREIINQLNQELINPIKIEDAVKRFDFKNYLNTQKELNDYYEFLSKKYEPWMLSIYETRGLLAELQNVRMIYKEMPEILKFNPEEFEKILKKIKIIDSMLSKNKKIFENIYFNFKKIKNTPLSQDKLKQIIKELENNKIELKKLQKEILEDTGHNCKDFQSLKKFLEFSNKLKEFKNYEKFIVFENFDEIKKVIRGYKELIKKEIYYKSKILEKVKEEFLFEDTKKQEEIFYKTSKFARITSKDYKFAKEKLNKFAKEKLSHNEWIEIFGDKHIYIIFLKKFKEFKKQNQKILKFLNQTDIKKLENIENQIQKTEEIVNLAKKINKENYKKIIINSFKKQYDEKILENIEKNSKEINEFFEGEIFNFKFNFEEFSSKLELLSKELERLNEILSFKEIFESLPIEVSEFVIKYSIENYEDPLTKVFLKSYYLQILDEMLKQENRISPKELTESFRKEDPKVREMFRFKIMQIIEENKIKKEIDRNEIDLIKREFQKKKRLKPIRDLIEQAPNLIFSLKPCFMMSPLTVSQYINPKSVKFDVVIFDEASQIMPEDAVSSLARANQAIIIGDTRQLPPTTFFMNESQEDEEDTDIEDLESFLSEASTRFNEESLNWHYRSENENLITFSNYSFYENKLITFPNPKIQEDAGLEFIYVENAIYDRGATKKNKKEAQEVVKVYLGLKEKYPEKSVGIVAFSRSQENAIREAFLDKEINLDSSMDSKEEELFIKNLESVQGDERDIIILSIGYGKDKDGRLLYNFGPINKEGGYKRLNVAITRARFKTIVISSIDPEEMDNKKLTNKGVKNLKEYLLYAKLKNLKLLNHSERTEMDNIFEKAVKKELERHGLEIESNLGSSEYKIDLAIKHPKNKNEYLLAIEFDGSQYKTSKLARDRDKVRKNMLKIRGWKIHRIWSEDWLNNKDKEIEKIKEKVNRILN